VGILLGDREELIGEVAVGTDLQVGRAPVEYGLV
jgi:hypothetical protein